MERNQQPPVDGLPAADALAKPATGRDRRTLLGVGSKLFMAGGLVAGYGTFCAYAVRYLFPTGSGKAWMFVSDAAQIVPGQSIAFQSPGGVRVTITRRQGEAPGNAPQVGEFLALSSVCPHLGCRVHWESQNNRFFCPCHNGVFDPDGKAVSGPPAAAGQVLPRYPLKIIDGSLYIEMPVSSVGKTA